MDTTLLPWIDPNKLNVSVLNFNPNAYKYIINNDLVHNTYIILNPSAFEYTKNYLLYLITEQNYKYMTMIQIFVMIDHPGIVDFIEMVGYNKEMFHHMCKNPHCIKFIEENKHNYHINWLSLAQNRAAVHLLEKYLYTNGILNTDILPEVWQYISLNTSPDAIKLLMRHPEYICWDELSSNPSAIKLLEENPTKINYWYLPLNTAAIHLIEANLSSVNLENLSRNPNAMHILEKHQHLIDWFAISENPSIFQYDYKTLSEKRTNILREELMATTLHPKRIKYWLDNGLEIDDL
jgi:hypothetical protein